MFYLQLQSDTPFGGGVRRLRFLSPRTFPSFYAGQYLSLLAQQDSPAQSTDAEVSFSIASPPHHLPDLELHYGPTIGNPDVVRMERLLSRPQIRVSAPRGSCWFEDNQLAQPVLLISAGTGIAQALSVVQHRAQLNSPEPLHLYWGVRLSEQLYIHDVLQEMAHTHSWLHYVPVISEENTTAYRRGLVADAVLADGLSLGTEVMICGGPAAVYGIFDRLTAAGMNPARAHSDVFSYAPRP